MGIDPAGKDEVEEALKTPANRKATGSEGITMELNARLKITAEAVLSEEQQGF
jgi:hypothetical protein